MPQQFSSLLAPVTLFITLSFVNFKAAIILLICVPLIPVSIIVIMRMAKKLFRKYWGSYVKIGKPDATHEQVVEAARKASVHDFIMTLPQGYDSRVGELGDRLSGGERQRLGLARAFVHNAPLLLLDEPTNNLDSLYEAIILKSLKEQQQDKTIVLVSHRSSTMRIADDIFEMDNRRLS